MIELSVKNHSRVVPRFRTVYVALCNSLRVKNVAADWSTKALVSESVREILGVNSVKGDQLPFVPVIETVSAT